MHVVEKIRLQYPADYAIACKINNLKHAELLQYFIDHVSFYAYIGGKMDSVYLWATAVVTEFKVEEHQKAPPATDPRIREISLKYLRILTSLSEETLPLGESETRRSLSVMKSWSEEMFPFTNYKKHIETFTGEKLDLTFDFNLLCSVLAMSSDQLLQYFINHISLTKDRVENLFGTGRTTPAMAVLLLLVSSHEETKSRFLPHQEIYKKFGLALIKLDRKQYSEADPEKRIAVYDAFYLEWFETLMKYSQ